MTRVGTLTWCALLELCAACSNADPRKVAGSADTTAPTSTPTGGTSVAVQPPSAAGSTSLAEDPGAAGGGGATSTGPAGKSAPAQPPDHLGAGRAGGNAGGAAGAAGNAVSAGASGTADPRGTGPGDWVAGDYPPDLTMQTYLELSGVPGQGSNTRQYKVHVPPSYDPMVPMPVVFCIHGLGMNAVMFCVDGTAMVAKSDSAGFIVVMPNGYANSWNGGTCCGDAATEKLDDVALMRAIFAEVSKHLNLDTSRVYATGLSNGGYMSYRLACEASDLFTAVAPAAGAIGMNDIGGGTTSTGDFEACTPDTKVAVLDLHGSEDPLIPYNLQKPSLERIAMANGCKLTTHPAAEPKSAADVTCVSYDDCAPGGEITGCTIQGGGHVWFGSENCGTGSEIGCAIVGANSDNLNNTDAVWDFFSKHSR